MSSSICFHKLCISCVFFSRNLFISSKFSNLVAQNCLYISLLTFYISRAYSDALSFTYNFIVCAFLPFLKQYLRGLLIFSKEKLTLDFVDFSLLHLCLLVHSFLLFISFLYFLWAQFHFFSQHLKMLIFRFSFFLIQGFKAIMFSINTALAVSHKFSYVVFYQQNIFHFPCNLFLTMHFEGMHQYQNI